MKNKVSTTLDKSKLFIFVIVKEEKKKSWPEYVLRMVIGLGFLNFGPAIGLFLCIGNFDFLISVDYRWRPSKVNLQK